MKLLHLLTVLGLLHTLSLVAGDQADTHDHARADIFTDIASYHVAYQEARRIQRALKKQEHLTKKHIAAIETFIDKLGSIDPKTGNDRSQAYQRTILDHLVRYRKLATICDAKPFKHNAFIRVEKMITHRYNIVLDILAIHNKFYLVQNTFNMLSPEEQQRLSSEYELKMKSLEAELYELEDKLAPVENFLCADDRTFWEKYGEIASTIGYGLTLFLIGKKLVDIGGDAYQKYQREKQG